MDEPETLRHRCCLIGEPRDVKRKTSQRVNVQRASEGVRMAKKKKSNDWTLHLGGPTEGPPTVEDIVAITKALTGREPSLEAIERVRRRLEEHERGLENSQEEGKEY
jgi:hypothetical protein